MNQFVDSLKITHVSIERIVTAVVSNDRQHSPNAENISMKWICIVTAENNTLSSTTQECIRSVVMPLTRQYHTDLLSQELFRLRTKFYMNTLLPKYKSVS